MARFLAAKTAPVQFCIGSASGGSGVFAESPVPEELDAIPSWYEEDWESKFRSSQRELKNLNEAALNPGRTWREGKTAEIFGPSPGFEYYPGGQPGAMEQKKKKSKSHRQNADWDVVRPDELYKAPADVPDSLVEAFEEPGA